MALGLAGLAAALALPRALAHDLGDPLTSACAAQVRADVAPARVSPGMTVSIRNRLVFSCPQRRRPYHLALVAWRPTDAAAVGAAWVPGAMASLATAVDPRAQGWVAVGAGVYADGARELCPPLRGPAAVEACAGRLVEPWALGAGARGLGDAVYQAWKSLRLARGEARLRLAEEPLRESLVAVVPDLPATAPGCSWARAAIAQAQADGVDVQLVCASGDCGADCLAGSVPPDRLRPRTAWPEVAQHVVALAEASELRVVGATLHENLEPLAWLVPGSADPAYKEYSEASGALFWQLEVPRTHAVEVSYALLPQARGDVMLTGQGLLGFVDSTGRPGSGVLPPRGVRVAWSTLLPVAVRMELGVSP